MASTPVEQIKERLSILDVVGGYVELQKAGRHFKGKSPFTSEKTPSFFVSPDRGMYYCFSSQKGGDMFTFIQEMEGVDFKGALKILAEKANVELVPEDPKKRDARDAQYALLEEATKYFFSSREEFEHVNSYITERGVTGTSIHAWRIGYARDEWRSLKNHLTEKGFTEEQIFKAGLIKKADAGKESYDVFRDRIMFPIMDPSGRVVAFSGRTLKSESGIPKYVNSPETELFQKSEILYGYDKAKHGIRHYDFSLIVEGQFDLVLAHQAGYANAVAVSGTALTAHHIMLLERLSNRVVLSLDADRAGISAVKRSALPMLEHGIDVKVAHMPEGEDPADVIRRDPSEFKKIVGQAVHVVEFLLAVLKETTKDERTYKLRVREEILPLLVAIQNRIDREHFENLIAVATETTKDAIHYEIERLITERGHSIRVPETPLQSEPIRGIQRKDSLMEHMYALMKASLGEHTWIQEEIKVQFATLLTKDELAELDLKYETQGGKSFFIIEQSLEHISEKELIEDVSEKLTALSHIIAREKLAAFGEEIRTAERESDEERLMKALEATKSAEKLLQSVILISKTA